MKNLITMTLFLIISNVNYGQSYLGKVIKQANFRQGPGKDYSIIMSLKEGAQIFIISADTENDYYNIIDIKTDKEGYVHRSLVELGEIVKVNEGGMFTPSGKTTTENPYIEIFNNTTITLTLKLNNDIYSFAPKETKKITLRPGMCNYRASAPGVTPYIGSENIQSNTFYTWQFYIISR